MTLWVELKCFYNIIFNLFSILKWEWGEESFPKAFVASSEDCFFFWSNVYSRRIANIDKPGLREKKESWINRKTFTESVLLSSFVSQLFPVMGESWDLLLWLSDMAWLQYSQLKNHKWFGYIKFDILLDWLHLENILKCWPNRSLNKVYLVLMS